MQKYLARVGLAIAIFAFIGTAMLSSPAMAFWSKVSEWQDDENGDIVELFKDNSNGKWGMHVIHDNGKEEWWQSSNPDPEGNGKGSDRPDVVSLLKQAKNAYRAHVNKEDSPLGTWTSLHGNGGRNSHWNPGDDQGITGHGNGLTHGSNDYNKTAKEKADEIRNENAQTKKLNTIGGSMGSGEEGGSENAPGVGNHGNGKHGGSDNSGSYKDRQNKSIGKTESLGPHPEVVNPPPKATPQN